MKRFKFKFETLEKVRKAKESQALRALAEAQNRLQICIAEKDSLASDMDRAYSRREELAAGTATSPSIGVLPLQLEDSFIEGQKIRIARQEQAIRRAKKSVDQAMRAYLVARRGTKMIERLREKALEDHRIQLKKWEQVRLDDLVVMRARLKETAREVDSEMEKTERESA